MAKLSEPPIPFRLYKHFAVATLVLTAAIAMFADEGKTNALSDSLENRQEQNRLMAVDADRHGKPRLVRSEEAPKGSFGPDSGSFGAPSSPSDRGRTRTTRQESGHSTGRSPVPGFDQAFINSLSEEEYQALLSMASRGVKQLTGEEQAAARRSMMERQRNIAGSRTTADYIP